MLKRVLLSLEMLALCAFFNISAYAGQIMMISTDPLEKGNAVPSKPQILYLESREAVEARKENHFSDLDHARMEHSRLVLPHLRLMREQFIEHVASPNFFGVSCKGFPIKIFIFPTLHTLPLEAIPSYVRKWIEAIAKTPHSQLYCEVFYEDDEDSESDDEDEGEADPRAKINVEAIVKRELESFTKICRHIYVKDTNPAPDANLEDAWFNVLQKFEQNARETLTTGWTKKLSPEAQEVLKRSNTDGLSYFDRLDPHCVYNRLFLLNFSEKRSSILQLDTAIKRLFIERNRSIQALETKDKRDDAYDEEALESPKEEESIFISLRLILNLIDQEVMKLSDVVEEDDDVPLYTPTLNDVNFSNWLVRSYLMGRPVDSGESISLNERNKMWWENTIFPLLKERALQLCHNSMTNLPPILMIYGVGHNEGADSITDNIRKLPGFQLHHLTRQGWVIE